MKLFVIAALITISSAARLEQLEQEKQLRAYLPPDRRDNGLQGNGINGIGPIPGAPNGAGGNDFTKYLPPINGAAGAAGRPQFAGSLNGFGPNPSSILIDPIQPGSPADLLIQPDASPQGSNNIGAIQPQLNSPAPSQEVPQQAFDEKTGYKY